MRSSTCGRWAVAERLRHEQRDAEHKLAFREVLGGTLMRRMRGGMGGLGRAVQALHVAEQEHALPGHQHVVEEDDAIHLLEARAERVIEMRPA